MAVYESSTNLRIDPNSTQVASDMYEDVAGNFIAKNTHALLVYCRRRGRRGAQW